MKMKGKDTFLASEIERLRVLIHLLEKADGSEKKGIRNKMRKIGFYLSDFGINGCQEHHFDELIRTGRLKILGGTIKSPILEIDAITRDMAPRSKKKTTAADYQEAQEQLINGHFSAVSALSGDMIPDESGLYCIKLRKGVVLPAKYGKVREDGIIYIGQASTSLRQRFWRQELNHHGAATFFRGIGAVLGYLPPKGSLYGKSTKNYKFSEQDTEAIREWIRQSLFVNWIPFATDNMDTVERELIQKYCPLMNTTHNPSSSSELAAARARCRAYARSK